MYVFVRCALAYALRLRSQCDDHRLVAARQASTHAHKLEVSFRVLDFSNWPVISPFQRAQQQSVDRASAIVGQASLHRALTPQLIAYYRMKVGRPSLKRM